ncbi:MAG: aromatic hydrocarbon degradation protein [Paracoccus denitrificans]|nr:MAG: aromatic hydrocarbon degradation protein [Paracoccus denitrificans]PZO84074.1 MAG: aromatic hydrocarbon degradation protein [Paracoccus denitrificans]
MKIFLTGVGALLLGTAPVLAGGIERAPQSLGILFEQGNYVEFNGGRVSPDVEGRDLLQYGGRKTGDVAGNYSFYGLGYKHQFNDNLSAALIVEQPYGSDVVYPRTTATSGSAMLGGTYATVDSTTYTAILRYRADNNFSIHGGIRGSHADGDVGLTGAAYGPLSGYRVQLDDTWGWGYVVGVSYERPEIGARVSLTYNSEIEHDFDTRETIGGNPVAPKSTTTVSTPKSWNLEAQTGIAEDTLLLGSIRWVDWSSFKVDPRFFTQAAGEGLVSLEDTTTYTIGVGRKFNDQWSGVFSFTYEPKNNKLVSPLAPYNGRKGISLAAIYTQDRFKITTGITYAKLGDADPETGTPDAARARMRDSDLLGVGVKVGYSF